ncbi:MAG: murB [Caulobacteraceae bacterium]|nr:murB [Caulobacteraceae bacterium]
MSWRQDLPLVRGRLLFDEVLAPFTWLRVGGPADALFLPADEEDLAVVLAALRPEVPLTVLGVGSNVIVRDGGVEGLVVRLAGRGFGGIEVEPEESRVIAGAAALDSALARAAATGGVGGLEFFAGIPGTVGGALTMNAGCYGGETADWLSVAWGLDRTGEPRVFTLADFAYGYRHSRAPADIVWTGAVFQGRPGERDDIEASIATITRRREATQPIREKTGGSTFKNPPGDSAWRLIDEAGWRGKARGGATFSALHANFLINSGEATAADLEDLGEAVRADVAEKFGVSLEWEIRRIGRRA